MADIYPILIGLALLASLCYLGLDFPEKSRHVNAQLFIARAFWILYAIAVISAIIMDLHEG